MDLITCEHSMVSTDSGFVITRHVNAYMWILPVSSPQLPWFIKSTGVGRCVFYRTLKVLSHHVNVGNALVNITLSCKWSLHEERYIHPFPIYFRKKNKQTKMSGFTSSKKPKQVFKIQVELEPRAGKCFVKAFYILFVCFCTWWLHISEERMGTVVL